MCGNVLEKSRSKSTILNFGTENIFMFQMLLQKRAILNKVKTPTLSAIHTALFKMIWVMSPLF